MSDERRDDAAEARAGEELPGPITRSPDLRRIRERRAKLHGWRRRLYDFRVVPAEIPDRFNEPLGTLAERLATDDAVTAMTILAEAETIFDETADRIESAERRATTLQGTVSIAALLVVPSAGLLLDPTRIHDRSWRIVLAVLLAGLVMCLIACAWRALTVTGRMFEFEQPGPERIHLRAKRAGPDAQTFRAAELLRAAGVASEIGAVKVGLLRSAAWWLRAALLVLAVVVIALGIYVVSRGSVSVSHARPPASHTRRS